MAEDRNVRNKYDPYDAVTDYDLTNGFGDNIGGGLKYLKNSGSALQSTSLNGIFGIPYQFLQSVDRRIDKNNNTSLGRKYTEKIMTHAPLLMITPCRQKFMEGFNSEEQASVISALVGGESVGGGELVGRYYNSEYAEDEYYACVNHMCAEVSHFLGIGDELYGGQRIDSIDWQSSSLKNNDLSAYFAAKRCVVFYADGLVSLQDSFGNSTTESSLASTINSFGDQQKELRFLLGGNSSIGGLYDKVAGSVSDSLTSIVAGLSGTDGSGITGGMLGDLASTGVSVALAGGKMIFPKLWGDSQSSRSYSFDIKLRSPDHDNISIFMNILVPYIHLLALCLPQSITENIGEGSSIIQNPNAYDTPFIVRAYCKGMFNINMGIVTDLSCTRGAEAQWNNAGLPTQMDVSISIEDLYNTLVMTNTDGNMGGSIGNAFDIVTNTEMIDFLSNLSGLNVATQEFDRRAELVPFLIGQTIKRVPEKLYHGIENGVSNMIRRFYYDKYF